MTAVIQTDALTKKYRRVAALDHVNLEVQEGTVYAYMLSLAGTAPEKPPPSKSS